VVGGAGQGGGARVLAVTPDQAPVASFLTKPQPVGAPSTFDASNSTVAYGSITSYRWSFGDGTTATTSGATTSHTYTRSGSFTIKVVETDSAGTTVAPAVSGTTLAVDGPGQTPYRRADPSAAAIATISVPSTDTTTPPSPTTPSGQPGQPGLPGAAKPQLTLRPPLGPPGTIVDVSGAGFPPDMAVTISWSTSTGSTLATTDGVGNLSAQLLVLIPDVLGARFATVSGFAGVTAPFQVVASTVEPGGPRARAVFRSQSP